MPAIFFTCNTTCSDTNNLSSMTATDFWCHMLNGVEVWYSMVLQGSVEQKINHTTFTSRGKKQYYQCPNLITTRDTKIYFNMPSQMLQQTLPISMKLTCRLHGFRALASHVNKQKLWCSPFLAKTKSSQRKILLACSWIVHLSQEFIKQLIKHHHLLEIINLSPYDKQYFYQMIAIIIIVGSCFFLACSMTMGWE